MALPARQEARVGVGGEYLSSHRLGAPVEHLADRHKSHGPLAVVRLEVCPGLVVEGRGVAIAGSGGREPLQVEERLRNDG